MFGRGDEAEAPLYIVESRFQAIAGGGRGAAIADQNAVVTQEIGVL